MVTGIQQPAPSEPKLFPWLWLLPSVAVVLALAVWGAVVYPDLPDRVPQQLGPGGVSTYADKSFWSVFLPVLVYAGIVLAMAGCTIGTLRMRPESEVRLTTWASSLANRPSTREGAARVARALLACTFCLGLTIAGACTVMWQTGPWQDPPAWFLPVILAPVVAGTVALIVAALRDKLSAPRPPSS